MAYCSKCGAYIPDGQAACLACGYNPAEEQKKAEQQRQSASRNRAGGAAYQYSSNNQELRRRLEEQRKRNQEQNRRLAEEEKRRREEIAAREEERRQRIERDRQWAEEEYEKRLEEQRQAEERRQEEEARQRAAYTQPGLSRARNADTSRVLAVLSYFSILFVLPHIFTPDDEYAKYHARQGFKLFLFGIAADILTGMVGFGFIFSIARLYLLIKGVINAYNGRKEPLPFIGTIGDS